jgi:fumarate reductase flavoprotein subunit
MQYDVVTIGGGFSGLVTACRAAELGLRAAVLEKETDERYHCSSRYSTGVTNVMGLTIMAQPDSIYDAIIGGSGGTADPKLARVVADNAKRTIAWLSGQGLRFIERAMEKDQPGPRVLAPPRRLQAGLDWEGRGADVSMRRLTERLVSLGGAVQRGVLVTEILVENGAAVGVAAVRDGAPLRIDARAVVIADGGFAANREAMGKFIMPRPDRVLCRVGPGAMGDGIFMAERAGAAIGGFGEFYGHIHHKNAMTNARLWPYPHLDAVAERSLLVNAVGARFADEGLGGVYMANAVAHLDDPLSAHVIIDEAIWQAEPKMSHTLACNPSMVTAGGPLTSAPDLETLAQRIEVPTKALEQTVQLYNNAVERDDYSSLEVARTVRKHKAMPIRQGPFHAVPLCAGVTGTMGGVVIDVHAQAQRQSESAFPGLYAVGTPVAGLEGGPRAGYVGGLSKAFILGLLAAEHIASSRA